MMKRQTTALLMVLPFSLLLYGCQSARLQLPENGITIELGSELPSSADAYITADEYQNITIDTSAVDSKTVGTYTVTVFYKDKEAGAVILNITDTTAPEAILPEIICLKTNTTLSVEELDAYISDFSKTQVWFLEDSLRITNELEPDINLSEENLINRVAVSEDGDYLITVLFKDIYGNYSLYPLNIEAYTPDTEAPIITADNLTVTIGEKPDYLAGVSALDNMDNDLTDQIQVDTSRVLLDEAGTYTIIYTVTDKAGNVCTKECQLTVQKPQKGATTQTQITETPQPTQESGAVSSPAPAHEPALEPTPESVPTPIPESTPDTTPIPTPEPTPMPTPEPAPEQTESPSISEIPESTTGFDAGKADELLALVNAERKSRGFGTVSVKESLVEKAKEKAQNGGSGSGVISCSGNGATNASIVVENWKKDWPDGTWMTANWKYVGIACYVDGGNYTWVAVFGAY